MKKTAILIITLFSILCSLQVNSQIIEEGFEGSFPPEGWTVVNNGAGSNWEENTLIFYTNTGAKSVSSGTNSINPADTWLFTKPVTLDIGDSADWSFYVRSLEDLGKLKFTVGTGVTVADQTTVLTNIHVDATSEFVKISGLFTATEVNDYYFAFNCYSDAAHFGVLLDDVVIKTITCSAPTDIVVSNIRATEAEISWTDASTAWEYVVQEGGIGEPVVSGNSSTAVTQVVTGLIPDTTYEVYVRTNCGAGDYSEWVVSTTFYTGPCIPKDTTDTDSPYYIDGFKTTRGITNITNTATGFTTGCYSNNYSSMSVSLAATRSFDFTIDVEGESRCTVFIDWNQDLVFDAYSGERVFIGDTRWDIQPFSRTITVPEGTANGDYRMRVVVNYYHYDPLTTCGVGNSHRTIRGEIEDYKIIVDETLLPTCFDPTDIEISNITETGADISWTDNASASAWEYEVREVGTGEPTTAGIQTTTPSGSVTGLVTNTHYKVYVRANCGVGDESVWASAEFFTGPCLPEVTTRSSTYIDSFTTTRGITNITNTATGFSAGNYGNYFGTASVSLAATRSFDFSAEIVGWRVGCAIWVDWNRDLVFDMATETVFQAGSLERGPFTGTITVPAGIADGDYRMRIMIDYDAVIDDDACTFNGSGGEVEDYKIVVDATLFPTCFEPTDVIISNITLTEANLAWTDNNTSTPVWEYVVQEAGTGEPTGSGTQVTTTVTSITGLMADTQYEVYVRSNCGAGDFSAWSRLENFTTLCNIITPNYVESFVTFLPECWKKAQGGDANTGPINYGYGSWNFHDTNLFFERESVSFDFDYGANKSWLISPNFDLSAGGYELKLDIADVGTRYDGGGGYDSSQSIQLLYTEDGVTWNNIITWASSSIDRQTIIPLNMQGEHVKFAFLASTEYHLSEHIFFMASFTIELGHTCFVPTDVITSNVRTTEVEISWTNNASATTWEYIIQPIGTGVPTAAGTSVTTVTTTATSLTPNTDYEVYVRADCGEGNFSDWSDPVAFYTGYCRPIRRNTSNYYIDGFTTRRGVTNISNTSSGYATNGYGNYYDSMSVSLAATRSFDFNIEILRQSYYTIWVDWNKDLIFNPETEEVFRSRYPYYSSRGTITVPAGIADGAYRMRVKYGSSLDPCTSGYESEDYKIIVDASLFPTCFEPTDAIITNITQTGVDIAWTDANTPTPVWEYIVQESGTGEPIGSGTQVTTTATSITGLMVDTSYGIYIRANCGAGDFSVWTRLESFTTLCNVITPYYVESFVTFLPECWEKAREGDASTGPINYGYGSWDFQNTNSYYFEGESVYFDFDYNSNESWLISPNFDLSVGGYELKLDVADVGTHYDGSSGGYDDSQSIQLLYTEDGVTWNNLITWDSSSPVGSRRTIIIPLNMQGEHVKFAFLASTEYRNFSEHAFYMANFAIELEQPICIAPTDLTALNATDTEVELAWVEGATASAWEYVVQAEGTGEPTGVGTPATFVRQTVTGLTPDTDYEVYVRADCGTGNFSDWFGPVSFFTGYCQPQGSANSSYYIYGFSTTRGITNITNTSSGYATNGYGNYYDSMGVSSAAGRSFDFSMEAVSSCAIWVDWNKDFNFTVVEKVFLQSADGSGSFTGTITIPAGTPNGEYRMRVRSGDYGGDACTVGSEIEDYKIIVDASLFPTCFEPTEVAISNITHMGVDLAWTDTVASVWEYVVQEAGAGVPTGSGTQVTTTAISVTGLMVDTLYDVYIRANCGGGDFSAWTRIENFTTLCNVYTPHYFQYFATFLPECWKEASGGDINSGPINYGSGAWNYHDTDYYFERESVYFDFDFGTNESWLISPSFDLSAGGYELKLDVADVGTHYDGSGGGYAANESIQLLYTEDGITWNNLTTWNSSNPVGNRQTIIIPLNMQGEHVKFAFLASTEHSLSEHAFYMASFIVKTTYALSIDDNNMDNFIMYPNPVTNVLNLKAQNRINAVSIYSMLGQEIWSKKTEDAHVQVDMSNFSSGTYIVRVKTANQVDFYTLIKE